MSSLVFSKMQMRFVQPSVFERLKTYGFLPRRDENFLECIGKRIERGVLQLGLDKIHTVEAVITMVNRIFGVGAGDLPVGEGVLRWENLEILVGEGIQPSAEGVQGVVKLIQQLD